MNPLMNVIWAVLETQLRQGESLAKTLAATGCSRAQQAEMMRMLLVLTKLRNRSSQLEAVHRQQYETRMGNIVAMAASAGIPFKPPRS